MNKFGMAETLQKILIVGLTETNCCEGDPYS
jgi:hypothetical protein